MRLRLFFPLLVAAAACGPDPERPVLDADGDHWVDGVDCDDRDADVHPYADEACDGRDNDCDSEIDEEGALNEVTWYADADGDGYGAATYTWLSCQEPMGYVENSLDCDDLDPDTNPLGTEVCDEQDNDCDGTVDELGSLYPTTWYRDSDSDGYGDAGYREEACEPSAGFVEDATDCDDTDGNVHPGAPELCDAQDVDEDCDGISDDADPDALGQSSWVWDGDGDTFGAEGGAVIARCDQPAGYSDNDLDCDDSARAVNPLAQERCGDGLDNDCDGLIDGADDDGDTVDWYADADGDAYGDFDAWWGDACEGPDGHVTGDLGFDCDDSDASVNPGETETWYDGVDADCDEASDFDADADSYDSADYEGDDCDDGDAAINPGRIEVCDDGLDNDCDEVVDACTVAAVFSGASDGDQAGTAVASAGDIDGDGLADILVGADHEDEGGAGAGAVYLLLGPQTGDVDLDDATAQLVGEEIGDHAGASVAGGGDADGDGTPDILVGAYGASFTDAGAGAAYLVSGPVEGDLDLADATARFLGEAAGDQAGWSVAMAGDVDDDGYDDLLMGAPDEDGGGSDAGAAYLVSGPISGVLYLWGADAKMMGVAGGDIVGTALAGAGDLDGDGYDDVILGAPYEHSGGSYTGAAYLLYGRFRGTFDLSEADARLSGQNSGDLAGWSVASAGDVNSDGYDDLVIGAPEDDSGGNGAGAAYVVLGPVDGDMGLGSADAKYVGENNDDLAGWSVCGGADFDADGASDLIIGARLEDTEASDAGAAYFVLSPMLGTVDLSSVSGKVAGEAGDDQAGYSVSGMGDVDGDGADDAMVGVPYEDGGGTDAGAAWLVTGGGWL